MTLTDKQKELARTLLATLNDDQELRTFLGPTTGSTPMLRKLEEYLRGKPEAPSLKSFEEFLAQTPSPTG